MKTIERNYSCKDEELLMIAAFVLLTLKRDLKDFTAFSPMINEEYVSSLEELLKEATGLVSTFTAFTRSKSATAQIYARMDEVMVILNRLSTYISLAGLNESDFAVASTRRKANSRDAEGLIQNLKNISDAVEVNKIILQGYGFSDEQAEQLVSIREAISADNLRQYEVVEERKALILDNRKTLGRLYRHISDICKIGKTLYKDVSPVKLQEYTFTKLVRRVRSAASVASKSVSEPS
jgi:hypothetical protein